MTTATKQKIEVTRKRNEAAIKAADRRSEELHASLARSRAVMKTVLETLKRAGYVK